MPGNAYASPAAVLYSAPTAAAPTAAWRAQPVWPQSAGELNRALASLQYWPGWAYFLGLSQLPSGQLTFHRANQREWSNAGMVGGVHCLW